MIDLNFEKQAHEEWYKNDDPIAYKWAKALSPEYETAFYDSEKGWLARAQNGYSTVNFGQGQIEVAEGIAQDSYALILGNNSSGAVGEPLQGNRFISHAETLAILKFTNVKSIDVVIEQLSRLRERVLNNEPVQILDDDGNIIQTVTPVLSNGA
ncbi:hypothetical protein [Acinetobacter calcoaceticus]|uniref:hypothetical protein n=1 Tax=Acinetobacter calcoaceticus TaxID=471 RepID=UPI003AF906DD